MKKFYKDPLGHYLRLRRVRHPTYKSKEKPEPKRKEEVDE